MSQRPGAAPYELRFVFPAVGMVVGRWKGVFVQRRGHGLLEIILFHPVYVIGGTEHPVYVVMPEPPLAVLFDKVAAVLAPAPVASKNIGQLFPVPYILVYPESAPVEP